MRCLEVERKWERVVWSKKKKKKKKEKRKGKGKGKSYLARAVVGRASRIIDPKKEERGEGGKEREKKLMTLLENI